MHKPAMLASASLIGRRVCMAALHRSCTSKTCLSSGTFWHTHSLDGVMSRETSCLTTLPPSASRSRSCSAARYEDAERPPTSQAIERNGVAPPRCEAVHFGRRSQPIWLLEQSKCVAVDHRVARFGIDSVQVAPSSHGGRVETCAKSCRLTIEEQE